MEYEKVRGKFGLWDKYFKEFIESDKFDEIFRTLKTRNKPTAPLSKDVFRAFEITDPDKLCCIIVGISPYHTFIDKAPVADGLALSCSHTWKKKGLQPSLEMVYDELQRTYQEDDMTRDGDLSYLAEQGVLLYNVGLTVQEGKACSDNELWSEFNKYFWTEVMNKYFRGIPIIFMGTQAHKSINYLTPMLHYPIQISHPASAAYKGDKWHSDGAFLKIDNVLRQNYKTKINWYKLPEKADSKPPWEE